MGCGEHYYHRSVSPLLLFRMHGTDISVSKAKAFLDNFHNKGMASMALILENETWNQTEIAPEFQQIAQDMIAPPKEDLFQGLQTPPTKRGPDASLRSSQSGVGGSSTEKAARSNSLESRPLNSNYRAQNGAATENHDNMKDSNGDKEGKGKTADTISPKPIETEKKPKREVEEKILMAQALDINGRQFHVVIAALMLLKTLSEYLNVLSLLPALNTDILPKYPPLPHV